MSLSLPWDSPPLRTRKNPGDSSDAVVAPARGVPGEDVLAERRPADAADHVGRAGEAHVDDLGRQADDLEDLRPPVRVDGGDAHLREDLEHARLDRGLEAVLRLGAGQRRRRRRSSASAGHRLQRQAGADGVGAVAEQAAKAWTSRASSATTTIEVAERRRRSVSAVVHGAAASSDGTGARSAPAAAAVEHEDAGAAARPRRRPRRPAARPRPAGPPGRRPRGRWRRAG